jgi:HK97 family phage prohead protease
MKVSIRADSVLIEGYVNAIERDSKPLMSRIGRFIERICKGAFSNALKRNDDVHVLLNHDWSRDLGSTKQGNLELTEDNIGLHARAVITDSDVIEKARRGDLVGWSFGFADLPDGVEQGQADGLPLRKVRDMDLREVSILDRTKAPAYDGTLIMARAEGDTQFFGEAFLDEIEIREEQTEEVRESDQPQLDEHPEADKSIDYSKFEAMILEMKGETK